MFVGGIPQPTSAMIFSKKKLFIRVKQNVGCLKNRTVVEADPGRLPTAKMNLFVTIVTAQGRIL